MRRLAPHGTVLEQSCRLRTVRQLFGPAVVSSTGGDKREALSGTAALPVPVPGPIRRNRSGFPAPRALAFLHGLSWSARISPGAARLSPAVDDLHWSRTLRMSNGVPDMRALVDQMRTHPACRMLAFLAGGTVPLRPEQP
jgi:hypothetical protein